MKHRSETEMQNRITEKMVKLIGVYIVPGEKDIYMIELIINQAPALVDISSILQKDDAKDKSDWQAPYDERYLDENGEIVIGDFFDHKALPRDTTRVIFYMYLESLDKPLSSPYGDISLVKPSNLPARLSAIDFEAMD